jgi:hypothetical protein
VATGSGRFGWRRALLVSIVWAVAVTAGACGGDDVGVAGGGSRDDPGDQSEFDGALRDAMGAGGGGTLVWAGTEHPIDSVVCSNQGERVDVGTIGEDFRVLISGEPPYEVQILDDEFVQWIGERAEDGTRAGLERSGDTFTAEGTFFRVDDTSVTREASFTIECP